MKLKILLLIFSIFAGIVSTGAAVDNTSVDVSAIIYNEAGMSAYTKANTAIDLDNVRGIFRIIEIETSDYIIGSVPVTSLPETEDVHAYVNKSGWILVYYPRAAPASKMVQWANYNGGPITTTLLADMVSAMASAAGVSHSGIKYYNFKYPGANRIMMIIDWVPEYGGYDSYDFKIPSSFVLSENSWSYRLGYGQCCNRYEWTHIDGVDFRSGEFAYDLTNYRVRYGYFSSTLSLNYFHRVEIDANNINDRGINTVLIYNEP